MTLICASDDFRFRTLSAFQSLLQKLAYVTGLRDKAGQYNHWGMVRVYGEKAGRAALAEVHSHLWLDVLRAPIPKLLDQLREMDADSRRELLTNLKDYRSMAHPGDLGGGSTRHFSSVLLTLESVCRSRDATPPSA